MTFVQFKWKGKHQKVQRFAFIPLGVLWYPMSKYTNTPKDKLSKQMWFTHLLHIICICFLKRCFEIYSDYIICIFLNPHPETDRFLLGEPWFLILKVYICICIFIIIIFLVSLSQCWLLVPACINPWSFLGNISKVVFHCFLARAKRERLAHSHPPGFVAKVRLELTAFQFMAWFLNHYTKLALAHQYAF